MRYINYKGEHGTETVDCLDPKDFESFWEFRDELSRLIREYQIAGMDVYRSTRATKEWRDKECKTEAQELEVMIRDVLSSHINTTYPNGVGSVYRCIEISSVNSITKQIIKNLQL